MTPEAFIEFRQILFFIAGIGGALTLLMGLAITAYETLRLRRSRKPVAPALSGSFHPESLDFAYAVTPGIALVIAGLLTVFYTATTPFSISVQMQRTALPQLGSANIDLTRTGSIDDDKEVLAFCDGVRGEIISITGQFADGGRGSVQRIVLLKALNSAANGNPGQGAQSIILNALTRDKDLGTIVRFIVANAIVEPDVANRFCSEITDDATAVPENLKQQSFYGELKQLLSNTYAE